MSDYENHQKRHRRDLGSGNPHPSTATQKPQGRPPADEVIRPADLEAIRATWLELHDVGLVCLQFPSHWRVAIELSLKLMRCEDECRNCYKHCLRPDYDGCPMLRQVISG